MLLLAGFLLLFEVFTFFDLLDDIAQHRTSVLDVVNYFLLSVLLLVLSARAAGLPGRGSGHARRDDQEQRTCGLQGRGRKPVPHRASPAWRWDLFAAGLLLLDDTYLPYANQRQDALRNADQGPARRKPITSRSRQWIFGDNSKIYNYQLFDPDQQLFGGLSVFELDPATFAVERRIYAERAHWEPQQNAWILESGWMRDFDGWQGRALRSLSRLLNSPNWTSRPAYFSREVRQSYQMNWWELRDYIAAAAGRPASTWRGFPYSCRRNWPSR